MSVSDYVILFFITMANSIMHHEDGHYQKASDYGLKPEINYLKRSVTYDETGTDRQNLDIFGAGITYEQDFKRGLNSHRSPNDLYSMYSLYMFGSRASSDARDYYEILPSERDQIRRASYIEPFIFLIQNYLNYIDSPFFASSWATLDRRGFDMYYEISFRIKF